MGRGGARAYLLGVARFGVADGANAAIGDLVSGWPNGKDQELLSPVLNFFVIFKFELEPAGLAVCHASGEELGDVGPAVERFGGSFLRSLSSLSIQNDSKSL